MRRIPDAVRQALAQDPIAYDALTEGILNCRAYAKRVLPKIEEWCKKPVKLGSVVTALTRLRHGLIAQPPLSPSFFITSLTLKTGLGEVAFVLSQDIDHVTEWVERYPKKKDDMVMIIRGNRELAIIAPDQMIRDISRHFKRRKPMGGIVGLVAVTVTYPSPEYLFIPNITYTLIRQFALRRINLVEKCSTYSEETFLVDEKDATTTLECLRPFLKG